MDYLRNLNLKTFLLYFCVAYAFLDITGAIVAGLNHTRGGIIHDPEPIVQNTNNTVNLIITVKSGQ
jgi:hypothetical protein